MRRLVIPIAALAACLALPGVASAHTGAVSCTDKGIVFAYAANFAHDTTVTENVNGVTKTFLVHANTASTDTIPAPAGSVIAGASWVDGTAAGSIPFVALTCAFTSPPASVCVPTAVGVPGPATTTYVDVPGAIQYVDRVKTKIVYRTRIKWKTRIKLVQFTPVKPVHGVLHSGGVTG